MLGRDFEVRTRFGRLTYGTKSQAMDVAGKLGLSGTHTHMMDGQRVYMPGTNHQRLNDALRERGMRPTPVPGNDGSMMSGGSMMGGGSGLTDSNSTSGGGLLGGMGDRDDDRDQARDTMLGGFDGMADRDRDRDRPSAFDQLGGDRDRGRDRRGTDLGDLAVGAVGLGLGLGALDALDDDAGGETDGMDIDGMDMDLGGFDG